ncbi:MAG: hypothetical protein CMO81_06900, partial [Waddliaceae bacterium]|nr:hypothetical protein [Waddliaceae bacterium]
AKEERENLFTNTINEIINIYSESQQHSPELVLIIKKTINEMEKKALKGAYSPELKEKQEILQELNFRKFLSVCSDHIKIPGKKQEFSFTLDSSSKEENTAFDGEENAKKAREPMAKAKTVSESGNSVAVVRTSCDVGTRAGDVSTGDYALTKEFTNMTLQVLADAAGHSQASGDGAKLTATIFAQTIEEGLSSKGTITGTQDLEEITANAMARVHAIIAESPKDYAVCTLGFTLSMTVDTSEGKKNITFGATAGDTAIYKLKPKLNDEEGYSATALSTIEYDDLTTSAANLQLGKAETLETDAKVGFQVFCKEVEEDELVLIVSDGPNDNAHPMRQNMDLNDAIKFLAENKRLPEQSSEHSIEEAINAFMNSNKGKKIESRCKLVENKDASSVSRRQQFNSSWNKSENKEESDVLNIITKSVQELTIEKWSNKPGSIEVVSDQFESNLTQTIGDREVYQIITDIRESYGRIVSFMKNNNDLLDKTPDKINDFQINVVGAISGLGGHSISESSFPKDETIRKTLKEMGTNQLDILKKFLTNHLDGLNSKSKVKDSAETFLSELKNVQALNPLPHSFQIPIPPPGKPDDCGFTLSKAVVPPK